MWVCDSHEEPITRVHFLIQNCQFLSRKIKAIEDEVHVFLRVLDVHPEHIHWEAILGEVL